MSPTLDGVEIGYDDPAPRAAIDGVDVSGTTAGVRFSSPDGDVTGMECSLDGGPFVGLHEPEGAHRPRSRRT